MNNPILSEQEREQERWRRLGERIGAARKSKALTLVQLANRAKLDEKTVRTAIDGGHVRLDSLHKICKALELDIEEEEDTVDIADDRFGAYNLEHYEEHVGHFYSYRRSFTYPTNILRSVFEITWSDDKGNEGFKFREVQKYHSKTSKKKIDFSQSGDVYISHKTGMIQLLTSNKGALRLITLTKLTDDVMSGIVLTQAEQRLFHQPSTSAIFLQKIADVLTEEDLSQSVGSLTPSDDGYDTASEILLEIERNIGVFALTPTGAKDNEVKNATFHSIKIAS
ncbi:helix-turn-helix domain-containing protein [Methylobacterium sp. CM6244]